MGRFRPRFVAIAARVDRAGIHAREKARPARRANRTLAERVAERDAFPAKPVDMRRPYRPVAESREGIPALLIRADPQNVGKGHRLAVCRFDDPSGASTDKS